MAVVKHIGSLTEAQILALTSSSDKWFEFAFYYPSDSNGGNYFFRLENGVMVKKGGGANGGDDGVGGVGITLNNLVVGGVKRLIESNDTLSIPENWDYNTYRLDVNGTINCAGTINLQ